MLATTSPQPRADSVEFPDEFRWRRRLVGFLAASMLAASCGASDDANSDSTASSDVIVVSSPESGAASAAAAADSDAPDGTDRHSDTAGAAGIIEMITGPDETTIDRFAVFSFEGGATDCRLDDGEFEACESPLLLAEVDEGTHQLDVRLTGDAETAASYEWEVLDLWAHPTEDIIAATMQPDAAEPQSWRGIFRINCDFSHSSYDDPIVFPGDEGAAHLHRFYGNTSVDFSTTTASLLVDGMSTCQGNELNSSGYWVPALLAPDDGSNDGWIPVPAVVGGSDEAHEVFYYSAGVDDLDSIQPIPVGLRIVAGDMSATPDDPQSTNIVRWHCQSWESNDATNPQFSATIPECEAPDRVRMDIFFPSCWNGIDLDSPDHKSHMAYPVTAADGEVVCPDSHPVPIVRPSYHYAFGVKPDVYDDATRSSSGWRLSSDSYTLDESAAGGASLHADWINGWHPTVMDAILEVCIQGGLDCHDGNLANGFRLGDVQEGTQNDPVVVNDGLGNGTHDGGTESHGMLNSPATVHDHADRIDS